VPVVASIETVLYALPHMRQELAGAAKSDRLACPPSRIYLYVTGRDGYGSAGEAHNTVVRPGLTTG
jgi:hypothetical protein